MLESEGDQNLAETSLGLYIGSFCLFGDFFFKIIFISLTERAHKQREHQREREKEKEAPPMSNKPNMGLDPRTLRSSPEPKADASPMEPPWCPRVGILN